MINDWLEARIWQIGASVAGLGAVSLGVLLLASKAEVAKQGKTIAAYEAKINDPKTGYIIRLSQCDANGRRLESALDEQGNKIDALRREGEAKLAAAKATIAAGQVERDRALARVALLSRPLVAADSCARVQEFDQRYLENLK